MLAYFVNVAHSFLAAAFVIGLLASQAAVPMRGRFAMLCAWCVALGLAVGWATFTVALQNRGVAEARTVLRLAGMAAALCVFAALVLGRRVEILPAPVLWGGACLIASALATENMFDFMARTADQTITVTTVANTELILNLAALGFASLVVGAVAPLVAHARRVAPVWARLTGCVLIAIALVRSGGDAMLGLLQLGLLEATSERISLVAKINQLAPFVTYADLVLVGLLAWACFVRRPRLETPAPRNAQSAHTARRKLLAAVLAERRWLRASVGTVSFICAMLLYQDLYASRPPRLSDAVPVKADASGQIDIKIDDLLDGKLHRFAFISSDGHRIRFFLINRYGPDHPRIGVVFDACMLCGDDGYIQVGNEVICVSCNVRIHIPSIGNLAGCNPIPLDHQVADGLIRIADTDLEQGARFFSEVLTIEVEDPVSGAKLTNQTAPFQDTHDDRVFFFASEANYLAFRADPERYAPRRLAPSRQNQ
jgi:uncharacterized membrane protein/YHS domain-containing protein